MHNFLISEILSSRILDEWQICQKLESYVFFCLYFESPTSKLLFCLTFTISLSLFQRNRYTDKVQNTIKTQKTDSIQFTEHSKSNNIHNMNGIKLQLIAFVLSASCKSWVLFGFQSSTNSLYILFIYYKTIPIFFLLHLSVTFKTKEYFYLLVIVTRSDLSI